jgi:hypothetical protein
MRTPRPWTGPGLRRKPQAAASPLLADLHVSADGGDADLFLTLRAFAPDGRELTFRGANDPRAPLSQGWLRLTHRAATGHDQCHGGHGTRTSPLSRPGLATLIPWP